MSWERKTSRLSSLEFGQGWLTLVDLSQIENLENKTGARFWILTDSTFAFYASKGLRGASLHRWASWQQGHRWPQEERRHDALDSYDWLWRYEIWKASDSFHEDFASKKTTLPRYELYHCSTVFVQSTETYECHRSAHMISNVCHRIIRIYQDFKIHHV